MTCTTCKRDDLTWRQMLKVASRAVDICRRCNAKKREAEKAARDTGETNVCNKATCAKAGQAQSIGAFYQRDDGASGACRRCILDAQKDYRRALGTKPKGPGGHGRELRGVDVTPCTRCSLRGHVAGDERCIQPKNVSGLGNQWWA